MKIAIIIGSPLKRSRLNAISDYFMEKAVSHHFEVSSLHLRDLPAEEVYYADVSGPHVQKYIKEIENADGVIVLSPVYKASISGVLKAFIDLLPMDVLKNKPVLPVMVGGSMAHLLAIEFSLNPLMSVIGASNIADGVYVKNAFIGIDEHGKSVIDKEIIQRLDRSYHQFIYFNRQAVSDSVCH